GIDVTVGLCERTLVVEQNLDRGVIAQAFDIAQPVDLVAASMADEAEVMIAVDVHAWVMVIVIGAKDFAVVQRFIDQRSKWDCSPRRLIRCLDGNHRLYRRQDWSVVDRRRSMHTPCRNRRSSDWLPYRDNRSLFGIMKLLPGMLSAAPGTPEFQIDLDRHLKLYGFPSQLGDALLRPRAAHQ